MVKMLLSNFHADLLFSYHRLHNHNIQKFVMPVNIFFIYFLAILSQCLKHCYKTYVDLFSSTLVDCLLEFFHASLDVKIRQLAGCTEFRVLKSTKFLQSTVFALFGKSQVVGFHSCCESLYLHWYTGIRYIVV